MAFDEFGGIIDENQPTLDEFGGMIDTAPVSDPTSLTRASRDQALAEREARGQEFIQQAQRPTLQKLIEGALGVGQALVHPVVALAKGAIAAPELVNDPSKILPTAGEAVRRTGLDVINLARAVSPPASENPLQAALRASLGPGLPLIEQLGKLAPRTPSAAEVETFLEQSPLEQELQKSRTGVEFQGAQPEVAEAITQGIELAPPIKGLQLVTRGVNVAKAPVERILRAALKPSKQVASRLEASTKNTISDIYHAAPDADKLGSMPLEGFQQTVNNVKKAVGAEVDEGLKATNSTLTAGDDIAKELNARADKLQKAGQPAASVQVLRDRAADLAGQVTEMDSLREAVTIANRENGPLFTRTREAANPLRAQADTIANEIIAKTGGAIENKALETLKGPEGALLRKKWSDLTLIEKQASDQLNKIINQAPPEIQSKVVGALASPEGLAGLFALSQGYLSGALGVAGGAVKSWARNFNKAARDSNALITSAYDKLRANPPPVPKKTLSLPPPLPEPLPTPPSLEEALQKALEERTLREQQGGQLSYF